MIYPFWEVNIKRCMLKNFDVTIVIIAIIAVLSEKTTKRTTGSHPVIVCVEEEVMLRASGLLGDVLHFLFFPFRVKRLSLFLRDLSVPLETGEKTMRARGVGGGAVKRARWFCGRDATTGCPVKWGEAVDGSRNVGWFLRLRRVATARNPLCSQATPTEDRALFWIRSEGKKFL